MSAKQSLNPTALPPSLQILHQKQQEYAGLMALKEASAALVARVEALAEQTSTVAEGGEAIGGVLRNWPHVFAIMNMFDTSQASAPPAERGADDEPPEPIPQLVRLPYGGEPVGR
ncbi:DASH complex subunit dad2 [Cryptotrichosporon argae]